MEKLLLNAENREHLGKGPCGQIRKQGLVPCVIYKGGKTGDSIQVNSRDLWKVLHTEAGENAIITMNIEGGGKTSKKTVIVQEVQTDPLKDHVIHVDFHEISLKEKLKVKVPVSLKGEAIGVKEEDGSVAQLMWELEVECLPTEIPEHIELHIDELHINESLSVKDITPSKDVVILDDPEQVVVSVHPPQAEAEEEEEVPAEEGGEEPEIIKKGKKEEEGAPEGEE